MGVDPNRLGAAIAAALQGVTIPQNAFVTPSKLEEIWIKVSDEIDKEYTAEAEVAPGTFEVTVSSFGTHPVTGVGGPVS